MLRHLQVPAIFIFPQSSFAAVFLQTWPKCVFASTAISILGSAWFSIQSWFCRSRASIFDAFLASAKSEHRVRKKERKKENIFEVRSKKKNRGRKSTFSERWAHPKQYTHISPFPVHTFRKCLIIRENIVKMGGKVCQLVDYSHKGHNLRHYYPLERQRSRWSFQTWNIAKISEPRKACILYKQTPHLALLFV